MGKWTLTRKLWGIFFLFQIFLDITCLPRAIQYIKPIYGSYGGEYIIPIAYDLAGLFCSYFFLIIAEDYRIFTAKRIVYSIMMLIPVLFVIGLNLLFRLT